jgi:uncharacterized spore protein YtfJ
MSDETTFVQAPVRKDHLDQLFGQIEEMQKNANVDAVFGAPLTSGDKIVIPIATVSYGFGLGFGEGMDKEGEGGTGGGGGAGATAKPVGLVEITPEGTHIKMVVNEQQVALAGIAFVAWSVFWIANALIRIFGRPKPAQPRAPGM